MGRILGEAWSIHDGKTSVNTQSYGPESRGGACKSEVVLSDEIIYYPNVRKADVLVALSQVAVLTYISNLKDGGGLLVDPFSIKEIPERQRFRVLEIPVLEIAQRLGQVKVQNMVALGGLYLFVAHLLKEESLKRAIAANVPPLTLQANLKGFDEGKAFARNALEIP